MFVINLDCLAPPSSSSPLLFLLSRRILCSIPPPPPPALVFFFSWWQCGVFRRDILCLWAFIFFISLFLGTLKVEPSIMTLKWPPCHKPRCYNTTRLRRHLHHHLHHHRCTSPSPLQGKLPPPADASRTIWPSQRWVYFSVKSCSMLVLVMLQACVFTALLFTINGLSCCCCESDSFILGLIHLQRAALPCGCSASSDRAGNTAPGYKCVRRCLSWL